MPRLGRPTAGDICYHVINRGNNRDRVFFNDRDYVEFIRLLETPDDRIDMRVSAYCLMPNHIHLVLWPREDGDLSRWMQRLLTSHVRRHHMRHGTSGHVWQGRFKGFPIQDDSHLLTVLRYVERNPVRGGLVQKAADWAWSSHSRPLATWPTQADRPNPLPLPADWPGFVDTPLTSGELESVRNSVNRGTPFGATSWTGPIATRLGLEASLRPRGRPKLPPSS